MSKYGSSRQVLIALVLTLTFFPMVVEAYSGVRGSTTWESGGEVYVFNDSLGELVASGDLDALGDFDFPYTQTTYGGTGIAPPQGSEMRIFIVFDAGPCGTPATTLLSYTELTFITGRFNTGTLIPELQCQVTAMVAAGQGSITPATQEVAFDGTAAFTVTPDTGWSVDSVSGNTCTPASVGGSSWEAANIRNVCTVDARFVINSYTVTAAVGAGNGTISPANQFVDHGSDATFTITPDAGWSVSSVTGDTCTPVNTSGSTWVASNVTAACAVTASFAQDPFVVTAMVAAGQGTITPATQEVAFDGTAAFSVAPDTGWSVDSVSGNTCTPTPVGGTSWQATNVQDNCAVEARFAINTYSVSASVGSGNGTISPASQTVDHGSNATFTIAPDTGWSVTSVTGDTCTPVNTSGSSWVASNIVEACAVVAKFQINTYTVGGTVTGLTAGSMVLQINDGDDLTVSSNGSFTFETPVEDLSEYRVEVFSQPIGQFCDVENGSGTLAGSNVDNVLVTCSVIELGLSLSDIALLSVPLGSSSEQPLTLSNPGAADLVIESFFAPEQPFGFDAGDCAPLPLTLTPGEFCTVMISFDAAALGTFDDELLIVSNALSSPHRVGLAASAVQAALPVPALGLPAVLLMMLGLALLASRRHQVSLRGERVDIGGAGDPRRNQE